jgi:hypothetical protein
MVKRTSLIILVTFLVIGNTVLNSFVSCCEAKEELFVNNDEQGCCICCNTSVDKTFLTSRSSGKSQATSDDCNSCVCIPYATTSDNYFVFIKRSILSFHFSPIVLSASIVENKVTGKHHNFFPQIIDQKTECLSTCVLLI